ncbi:acyl carrier protein [Streptomyces sp. NPDC090022]|uniref:acyl carrier protein n=1 Tax=Streptomyces sp. NPDC090022 TaxID=3365920 RepID=UPI0038218824
MTEQAAQTFDAAALATLVKDYFALPAEKLVPSATIADLGLDSLALMELMVAVEERTGTGLVAHLGDVSPHHTLEDLARNLNDTMTGPKGTAAGQGAAVLDLRPEGS